MSDGTHLPIQTGTSSLSMDTHNEREGLHLWLTGVAATPYRPDSSLSSISIHLTREQARQLVKEIQRRLF